MVDSGAADEGVRLIEGLEIATAAANDSIPVVAAHVVQHDLMIAGQCCHLVDVEDLAVDVVGAADVASVAGCLDERLADLDDRRDDVEVREPEGAIGCFSTCLALRIPVRHLHVRLVRDDESRVEIRHIGGGADSSLEYLLHSNLSPRPAVMRLATRACAFLSTQDEASQLS